MMTLETFLQHAKAQQQQGITRFVIPVYKRLSADLLTPVSAFLTLRQGSHHAFLLESVEGGEKLARYSFLGKNPFCIIKAFGKEVTVTDAEGNVSAPGERDVFDVLQSMLDRYQEVVLPGMPRFTGGAVGYFGYDVVRLIEHLPNPPPDDLHLPDALWCFYNTIIAFDRVKHQLVLMANAFCDPDTDLEAVFEAAQQRIARLEEELTRPLPSTEPISFAPGALSSNVTREHFEEAVEQARHYIYEGDIFQVVLSQRFALPFTGDRFNLYRALRQVNPSPYLFYLDFDEVTLVGSSPEVLVRTEKGKVELLPIAGTRPRGASPEEDAALAEELLADPKERAEHLMLVDLGRNDLSRVCRYDSVKVDRYAFIERYSHVMHIVSSVSGLLGQKRGAMDVLKACFPAGTVSGAPKVRAMEIIDALEPTRRGIYSGAVGYVDYSGTMDTCIAIRTMVVKDQTAYIQAGAGIVADSVPANEFAETENKARALRQAILLASEGLL